MNSTRFPGSSTLYKGFKHCFFIQRNVKCSDYLPSWELFFELCQCRRENNACMLSAVPQGCALWAVLNPAQRPGVNILIWAVTFLASSTRPQDSTRAHFLSTAEQGQWEKTLHIAVLVVNYGISNTTVLEIPQFTIKTAICLLSLASALLSHS